VSKQAGKEREVDTVIFGREKNLDDDDGLDREK